VADVEAAAVRIAGRVHRTPVLTSATLDRELGLHVAFKAEHLQKVGAFKARGALNAILALDDARRARGVVTHSSGNHGQAVAWAAAERGVPCWVVMPHDTNPVKAAAVRGYGATVVGCAASDRQAVADRVVAETGAAFVHPYADPHVIAGQGTAVLELLDEVGPLDAVIAPVSGGGLLAGTAIVVAARLPGAAIIGAEPEAVDDAARSFATGVLQPAVPDPTTLADGLRAGLGALNFAILRRLGAEIVTVSEDELVEAARFHLERMKQLVEPSGAAGLAAARRIAHRFPGGRVGVIISGGNTDLAWLDR